MRWSRAWTVPALVVKLTVMRVSYCGDLGMMQRKAQREEFLLPRKKKKIFFQNPFQVCCFEIFFLAMGILNRF